jgi:hypothetical protein
MSTRSSFLLASLLLVAVPAGAEDKPAKAPAAKPEKGKGEPAKDEKKPEEAELGTEVIVLHATNSKKGIDGRIGNMPELKKPPFSSYDSYELLSKTRLPLSKDDQTMNLPNGRVLKTKLLEVMKDKQHLRISASINRPKGKTFLPLLEVKAKLGQAFIVAGQSYKGGILVLVIRVVK